MALTVRLYRMNTTKDSPKMDHAKGLAFTIRTKSPYDCAGAVFLAERSGFSGPILEKARALASGVNEYELFLEKPMFYLTADPRGFPEDICDRLRDADFHLAVLRQQGYNQLVDELEEDMEDELGPYADEIRASREEVLKLDLHSAMFAAVRRILGA